MADDQRKKEKALTDSKNNFSEEQIANRANIALSSSISEDPNNYNCAGFVLYAVGESMTERRVDPEGEEMKNALRKRQELGESNTYNVSLAEKAKFVGIRYKISLPSGDTFYRYSHFALIDPLNKSFLYERKGAAEEVVRLEGNQALEEFLVPISVGGIERPAKIVYFQ